MIQSPRPDPEQIADRLIQQHGLDRAVEIALEQTIRVQADQDLYALSIWREIKRALRVKALEAPSTGPTR
jgi:hypothetical protein